MIKELAIIIVSVVFVNNFVLAKFLGLCPFLGVSQKTSSALGMGAAVTFVMTLASAITWILYNYILLPGDANIVGMVFPSIGETGLIEVLKTISYILVIATLVQLVEMMLRKMVPALYDSLGVFLPLITTNCAVLGVALLNTTDSPQHLGFIEAIVQGFGAGIGFTVAILLMSGIRERLALLSIPKPLQGLPIAFICTGLMALAFFGFSGMVP
ncbi:putative inner membrane subunit of an electron transport system [Candidatus Kuenenia stuttgartiensis]|jgi:electron transport complex protein RnfA|uniref:Ion-translocating oxidoreductase complex subunit A n=1 Tax=Kuenenia stuttgartiensis TaxID=174633 RepID=Q1PW70_KUEST|nr:MULTISPECIES: RnfABCDGE type electron transport complex subunit A [Kuenenia]MCZ7562412.1 RnfABCDGE type electron transport complex subunit A [Burkholderiales bacterium]MCF6152770.1 RnfABCDGE type electron transport complex subunit A [Candidatus Kuenenia stuttgartiensis]MCZ7622989.1 RnfABCDGE type electron transport complex subunit A [Candidatus Kuenenia sp.]QII14036.1 putative inner membrane subunit of an electron transport system [Candidatus Kuenenia stuttgartiensis]CAJ71477.1 similar to N